VPSGTKEYDVLKVVTIHDQAAEKTAAAENTDVENTDAAETD
jgi:hypothetical protein